MSFSLRFLMREWKGGDLPLLLFSLTMAVFMVVGISYFSQLLGKHIVGESSRFLSADRMMESSLPVPQLWLDEARNRQLDMASLWQFSSMVMAGDEMQLCEINAASEKFPLKGELQISEQPGAEILKVRQLPAPGEVWVEPRLLRVLNLQVGDQLELGLSKLTISAVLHQGAGFGNYWSAGPRILMNLSDVEATGLIVPASRVEYRHLFAGSEENLGAYEQWLKPQLNSSHKWLGIGEVGGNVGRSINRAEQFLLLGAALAVWLSGLAVLLLAQKYTLRHVQTVAMLRTLGVSRNRVALLFGLMTFSLLLLGFLLGAILASSIAWQLYGVWVDANAVFNPALLYKPLLLGFLTALGCFLLAVLPGVWQLANTSPMLLFREGMSHGRKGAITAVVLVMLFLPILVALYTGSLKLSLLLVSGLAALFLMMSLLVLLLVYIGKRASHRFGVAGHLALASLWRNRWQNAGQLFVIATSLCLMLLAVLMRTSLLSEWQAQMGEGTPNHFVLNLYEEQATELEGLLKEHQIDSNLVYPMIRGRLVEINSQRVTQRVSKEEMDSASVDRELNLSWAVDLPVENELLEGQWWQADETRPVVSVEQRLAKRLDLKMGDKLKFRIGGLELEAEISSIRKLDWNSMNPGFYMIFPPEVLRAYSATYMTSFYLPEEKRYFQDIIVKAFPNMNLIDVASMVGQVQGIIDRVSLMVQLLMACVMVAALLLMTVSIYTAMIWRLRENALLKAFGSSKAILNRRLVIEYGLLALLSGLVATVGAELITWVLQQRWFSMQWQPHMETWLLGPMIALILVLAVVLLFIRRLLVVPVKTVLD